VEVRDGGTPVARGVPGEVPTDRPAPLTFEEAVAAI
jgi:hypothetical protein